MERKAVLLMVEEKNNLLLQLKNSVIATRLKQNSSFYASYYFVKHHKRMCELILLAQKSERVIFFEKYGENNPEKRFYYINHKRAEGFFAHYREMVYELMVAEALNCIPVVEWNAKNFWYADKEGREYESPFEFYFYQPGNISLREMKSSKYVVESNLQHLPLAATEWKYKKQDVFFREGQIIRKFIRIKPIVQSYIENDLRNSLLDHRVIGVHYRGGDYKVGYKGHPVCVTLDETYDALISMMKETKIERVFLATDDQQALNFFRQKLGSALVFYEDVNRTNDDSFIAADAGESFKLGMDVLRDAYTLAMCTCVISGLSNVGWAADAINAAWHKPFERRVILDNGINEFGPIA